MLEESTVAKLVLRPQRTFISTRMYCFSALTTLTSVLVLVVSPVFAVDAVVKIMKDVSCNVEASRWRPNCDGTCFQVRISVEEQDVELTHFHGWTV
jgi:hypothetical protein